MLRKKDVNSGKWPLTQKCFVLGSLPVSVYLDFLLAIIVFALEVITDAEAHWVEEPSYLEPEEVQDLIGKIEAERDLGLCNENPPKNWKLNAQMTLVCTLSLCEVQGHVYQLLLVVALEAWVSN